MKYYTHVWCMSQKSKSLVLLRPQIGHVSSGTASVGEESRKTALKAGLLQMLEKELAWNYSQTDVWYIQLMGTKSVSISSPGDSRSCAGGAEAEVSHCCSEEVFFRKAKSARACGPAPHRLWDSQGQLVRVRSERPQLCPGNERATRGAVPAGGRECRRKSSTEETWHGKYAKENNLVQNHVKYTYMPWGQHRSSHKAATWSQAHPRAQLESAQEPFPSVARIRGRWQGLRFSHLSQVVQAYSPDMFCNTHLLRYSLDVVYLHTSERLPGLPLQLHGRRWLQFPVTSSTPLQNALRI